MHQYVLCVKSGKKEDKQNCHQTIAVKYTPYIHITKAYINIMLLRRLQVP